MTYSKEIQDAVRVAVVAKGFDGATMTITRPAATHTEGLVYAREAGMRRKCFVGSVEQLLTSK